MLNTETLETMKLHNERKLESEILEPVLPFNISVG